MLHIEVSMCRPTLPKSVTPLLVLPVAIYLHDGNVEKHLLAGTQFQTHRLILLWKKLSSLSMPWHVCKKRCLFQTLAKTCLPSVQLNPYGKKSFWCAPQHPKVQRHLSLSLSLKFFFSALGLLSFPQSMMLSKVMPNILSCCSFHSCRIAALLDSKTLQPIPFFGSISGYALGLNSAVTYTEDPLIFRCD